MLPAARRRGLWIALILAGTVFALIAGVHLFRRGGEGHDPTSSAPVGTKTLYHCPMHPAMVSNKPGECPICQMRLIPVEQPRTARTLRTQTAPATPPVRRKVLYRSTMNPSEVSDNPGKDSMGMERVPVEASGAFEGASVEGLAGVRISTRRQQLIGVRTAPVKRAPFVRRIRAVGRVAADETRLHQVHTKIEGWVETLQVNATGERVRKGQPLLSIYSPELVATQEEYLLALRAQQHAGEGTLPEIAQGSGALVESARRRLLLFDFTENQIHQLETSEKPSRTVTLFAPASGYVLKRNVTQGEKIDPNTNLLDIVDLSEVWVLASIYEYELPFVKVGQRATMTLSYLPGKTYRGRVGLVYPVLEGTTRTVQVRLQFPNPGLELKPEMYADVELQSDLGERVTVPETAVLASGTRNIVFVAQGDGYFEPREVRIGLRLPDSVEVLGGLAEGEQVVTSGNFLIDSESKLQAALEAAAAPR